MVRYSIETRASTLALALLLGACGAPPPAADLPRGPTGKADLPGSCRLLDGQGQTAGDACGAQSPDGCWCDDLCTEYGDCCADVVAVCRPPSPPNTRRTFADDLAIPPDHEAVPLLLFDADATLRISKSGAKSPDGPEDVMLLPGVAPELRTLAASDDPPLVAVVSNQGGVHYGYLSFADAESALARTAALLAARGAPVHYFDFAEGYDDNRKPHTGMAARLEQKLAEELGVAVDWERSRMVGDAGWKKDVDLEPDGQPGVDFSNSDRGFAEALGIDYVHPRDFFGWSALGVRRFDSRAQVEAFLAAHPHFDE